MAEKNGQMWLCPALGATLAAVSSLVEFTPRIKHFRFTFSFNTSSSIRVICYTFNCSSFEFSSPRLVPLQHRYLVILLLLLIANTCQLSSAANSGAGAWRGVYRETFTKLIRWFTQQLIQISKLRAKTTADLHPALRRAVPIWGGSLRWKRGAEPSFPLAAVSLLLPAINKLRVFKKLMSALVGVCLVTSAGEQPGSSAAQAGSRQGAEGVCL